jgi:hypothetical protein
MGGRNRCFDSGSGMECGRAEVRAGGGLLDGVKIGLLPTNPETYARLTRAGPGSPSRRPHQNRQILPPAKCSALRFRRATG